MAFRPLMGLQIGFGPSDRHALVVASAVGLGVFGLAAGVAALVVTEATDAWGLSAYALVPLNVSVAIPFSAMGALVASRRPWSRVGWLLVGIGTCAGAAVLLTVLTGTGHTPEDTVIRLAMWVQLWLWAPAIWAMATLLPLIYPDGRLPSPQWWPVAVGAVTAIALFVVGLALLDENYVGRYIVSNPLGRSEFQGMARLLRNTGFVLGLLSALAALVSLIVRWQRTTGLERRQLTLFLGALGLGALQAGARMLLQPVLSPAVDHGLEVGAAVLLPTAIAVAVTRDRLYDLDLTVRRAIVAVSLAACLMVCYLSAFAVFSTVLPIHIVVGPSLAAGLTGALIHPFAVLLSRAVNRLFYGVRADPYEVALALGQRLRDRLEATEVPAVVCRTVVDALRLSGACLEMDTASGTRRLARARIGDTSDNILPSTFELRHRGERVGRLIVQPPEGQHRIDEADARVLASLADQIAPVVAASRLHEELLHSRERLVTAREEERRRLRRDLHDGMGPVLAGTRLQLETAHRQLSMNSHARVLIEQAAGGVHEALANVRRIVHDLRPLALDELGLAGAIRELAACLSGPTLRIQTTVSDHIPPLPAAVEVAVYRIVAEALTNVACHAQATDASVSLVLGGEDVVIEIADDGTGFPAQPGSNGVGLSSMVERAYEIGGRCAVYSGPRGTTVRAVIPRWLA